MVREQCVALHVVQLAVARVRQLRRRRGDVLRRIQAQQVVEPRLHLVSSSIPGHNTILREMHTQTLEIFLTASITHDLASQ